MAKPWIHEIMYDILRYLSYVTEKRETQNDNIFFSSLPSMFTDKNNRIKSTSGV